MTDPAQTPQSPQARRPRLYRSRTERVIGGVAGGLAAYFGLDPVIVRILFVVLLFMGPGFLVYIIAWIAIPEAPDGEEPAAVTSRKAAPSNQSTRWIVGGILIVVGAWWLVRTVVADFVPWLSDLLLPVLLIGVGSALAVYALKK